MTQFLSADDVIRLHDLESSAPVIDRSKLESAIGEPQQTWDGRYLHPALLEQAAVLARGVAQAHGFLDGNKRAAWLACVTFLSLNGVEVEKVSDDVSERLVKQIATGDATVADITVWLAMHT